MPSSPARQAVTSMFGELSRQHAMGKRTGRANLRYVPAVQSVHVAGVGNANLSKITKRKENKYAGHNDDKRIIVTAAGGCDEWTVAWG
jgi:hypothetical protein